MNCRQSADGARGWSLVKKNISRIQEYGREEGILPPLAQLDESQGPGGLAGVIAQAQDDEGNDAKTKQSSDKVGRPARSD